MPIITPPLLKDLNGVDGQITGVFVGRRLSVSSLSPYVAFDSDKLNDPYKIGVTYILWKFEDKSGNIKYCEQSVTVIDDKLPTLICPSTSDLGEIPTKLDECATSLELVLNQVSDLLKPSVFYDCSSVSGISLKMFYRVKGTTTWTEIIDNSELLFNKGIIYELDWRFYKYITNDDRYVYASCIQIFSVVDTEKPVFDCDNLKDLVFELQADKCEAIKDEIELLLGTHKAMDNCDGEVNGLAKIKDINNNYLELPSSFRKDTTYVIAWIFKDLSDNVTICYQNLSIKDVTPPNPSAVCPPERTVIKATSKCNLEYSDLSLPSISLNDPCDGILTPVVVGKINQKNGSVNQYSNEQLKDIIYPIGTHEFNWIFTDNAGLKDTCIMNLTIEDMNNPVVDCGFANEFSAYVKSEYCSVYLNELEPSLIEPVATDKCTGEKIIPAIEVWHNGNLLPNSGSPSSILNTQPFFVGTTIVKWIFTNKANNTVVCSKTITVIDTIYTIIDCSTMDPKL